MPIGYKSCQTLYQWGHGGNGVSGHNIGSAQHDAVSSGTISVQHLPFIFGLTFSYHLISSLLFYHDDGICGANSGTDPAPFAVIQVRSKTAAPIADTRFGAVNIAGTTLIAFAQLVYWPLKPHVASLHHPELAHHLFNFRHVLRIFDSQLHS
jgi:hypothetical protein